MEWTASIVQFFNIFLTPSGIVSLFGSAVVLGLVSLLIEMHTKPTTEKKAFLFIAGVVLLFGSRALCMHPSLL